MFCPSPPAGEAHVGIHHIQEKTTSSCESVFEQTFVLSSPPELLLLKDL